MIRFENLLSINKSFQYTLLADDLRDITDRGPDWVTSYRVAEKEEYVLVFVREFGLLILLVQVG